MKERIIHIIKTTTIAEVALLLFDEDIIAVIANHSRVPLKSFEYVELCAIAEHSFLFD